MERRGRRPRDWDGTISCRFCAEPVVLERARMTNVGSEWHITCPQCKSTFAVRHNDADLGMVWEITRRSK